MARHLQYEWIVGAYDNALPSPWKECLFSRDVSILVVRFLLKSLRHGRSAGDHLTQMGTRRPIDGKTARYPPSRGVPRTSDGHGATGGIAGDGAEEEGGSSIRHAHRLNLSY